MAWHVVHELQTIIAVVDSYCSISLRCCELYAQLTETTDTDDAYQIAMSQERGGFLNGSISRGLLISRLSAE